MQSYTNPEECPLHSAALTRVLSHKGQIEEIQIADTGARNAGEQNATSPGAAVLVAPEEKLSLPRSGTLGLHEVDSLMSRRYVNLIGIVGLPDAGKTACLASLYLLLAHRQLKGFSYANSQSLMALDEIARGARRWNEGNPPTQMTAHTELTDVRQAGFLHLRLQRDADGRKFDIVLPDLPGEWSRSLISNGDAEKFKFIKAAEVVWLMVDGRELVEEKTRQFSIYQVSNLIERLAAVLPTPRPRVILVATWRDLGEFPEEVFEQVKAYGLAHNFAIELATIASFSDNNDVPPGIGLATLIDDTLSSPHVRLNPWCQAEDKHSIRAFLNFGKDK